MDMSKFLIDDYFVAHEHEAAYMMGSSDPESLVLHEIVEDFMKYGAVTLGYELGAGLVDLRKKLAKLYETVPHENIAVFNGGEETIYVTMRALLHKGDEIVTHICNIVCASIVFCRRCSGVSNVTMNYAPILFRIALIMIDGYTIANCE